MHFISHRCQVNQNQCMWSQHRKHSWTLPKYGFARNLFKDSRFLLRPGVFGNRRNCATDRVFPRGSRHLFWSHTRDNGARLQEDGHERFGLDGDKEGVLLLLLDKGAKECRPEGQDKQIVRQVSPTQSHQSNGAAENAVSTVRGLAGTYLAVLKDKIPSFEVTTQSPMLPWTLNTM